MNRHSIVLLLVAACVAGCGERSRDIPPEVTPVQVVREALDAIRAEDGERLLACVHPPPGKPHDRNDFSAVEETLSKLGDVEFTPIAPETAVTEDQRVLVVPVVLRTPDRGESRVVGGLTLSRQAEVWAITARSLRALLIQALDIATGTSRPGG